MPSPLQQARPTDPYVRWEPHAHAARHVLVDGDHVAWTHEARTPGEVWASALGDDVARIAALLDRLDRLDRFEGLTVPDGLQARLPERLRQPEFGHWSFWHLVDVDRRRPHAAEPIASDDPRIDPLLAHSRSASHFAGDPSVVRWFGVVDGDALVSVAGQVEGADRSACIVSVCTHPEVRGRGLAADPCSAVIEAALGEGAPAVWLEMYAANESARRLYRRLGFDETARFCSGFRPRVTA